MIHRGASLARACLFVAAVALVAAGNVPAVSAAPLTLAQAVERSLATSPALAAEAQDLRATESRAQREALPTAWSVSAELENVAGSGALSGLDAAETTLRLGRVLELGGKRAARETLGNAEVARQGHIADAARLQVAAMTSARFIEVIADQERLHLAHDQVQLAEHARAEAERWVQAARNPETDLRAAELVLADAELEREHAEHELASARVTLASSWGAFEPDFIDAAGSLNELPPAASLEHLVARLPSSLAQRGSQLEAATTAARRALAAASATPDLSLSLGVRRLEVFDDYGLVFGMSMPLGTRSRASYSAAESAAQLAALQLRGTAMHVDSYQLLFETYQELIHARTEHHALRTSMLPKAEHAQTLARRGFEAGRFSFAALSQAQHTLLTLRRRGVDAAARYHTLLVEVERLTAGKPEATP